MNPYRISISIEKKLARRLKLFAIDSEISMKQAIQMALEKFLKEETPNDTNTSDCIFPDRERAKNGTCRNSRCVQDSSGNEKKFICSDDDHNWRK